MPTNFFDLVSRGPIGKRNPFHLAVRPVKVSTRKECQIKTKLSGFKYIRHFSTRNGLDRAKMKSVDIWIYLTATLLNVHKNILFL